MKKIAILLIILMMLCVGFLSGCNDTSNKNNTNDKLKPDEYAIIGTWVGLYNPDDYYFRFFSDKTYTFSASVGLGASGSGTWEITDDKLNLTLISGDESVIDVYDYSFSNNGKELTLTNERGTIYLTKQ
jgi:hypothetical protein